MEQKTILIMAENGSDRKLMTSILETQYKILDAADEAEALRDLENSHENISLILLFLKAQAEDEFALMDTLQADPVFASVPIVAAAKDDRDEVAAFAHGASDFVTVLCSPQVICCRVQNIIQTRELTVMPDQYQCDRMTGLYSKEYFYQCASEILMQDTGGKYDIICSNFDNFKLINEVYGRQTGDRILCATADKLKRAMRGRGICSHFSSDWFACMVKHYDSYSDEMFERITDVVNQFTAVKNISIKWGIYVTGSREIPIEQMCDWALETARSIKGQYGKYFAYYDDELRNSLIREQEITACMETALEEGQFHVWLQPKYRMDGAPLHDAEALVRWFHPEWGIQQPGSFIPLFERNGFITKLDLYICEEVCRLLRDWDNSQTEPLNISVNVSRADIYKVDLCDTLVRMTGKYGIPHSRLHLEVTESLFTENPEQIVKTIRELRKKGFVIEMDDFGSGYSSLGMLNRVPMDILKLDMQFVRSEMSRPEKQGILKYIIGLAHWQNLEVVAEGVETGRQMERLRDLDCDYIQGYYMAKPMPPEEFEKLLYCRSDKASGVRDEKISAKRDTENNGVLFVIHEDPSVRTQMNDVFQDQFQVREAADEEAALSGLGRFGNRIRAILLDTELAGRDQSSLWKTLKNEKKLWNAPVILLGSADTETEAEALKMGADDFEGMPCRNESILMRVNNAVGRKEYLRQQMLNDSLPGGMFGCYWEDGFPVYFINGTMLDALGYDNETDFIADNDGMMLNCIHPDDRAAVSETLDRQLPGNLQYSLEYRIRKKNKSYIWVQDIGRLARAENGRDALVSVCFDITAQKKRQNMERELYDREMAYFSANSVEIQGRINVTRGRVERYFHTADVSISHDGDSFKQMVTRLADTAVEPSYREKLLSELSRKNLLSNFQSGKQEYHFEFLRKKNDGMFWASMEFRLYLNPDTQDVMMFFYTQDVTEQKVRDYTFDFIAKMDYDLICDVDMVRGTYQMLSRRTENGTTLADSGVFQDEIRRKTCRLMDEETCRKYLECMDFDNIQKQLEDRKVYSFVLKMNDANGTVRMKKYQLFYINEPLRRVGITRTDVTDVAMA